MTGKHGKVEVERKQGWGAGVWSLKILGELELSYSHTAELELSYSHTAELELSYSYSA